LGSKDRAKKVNTVKLGYNELYGPRKSVRYNREIVITVKVYVVKVPFGKSGVIFVHYSCEIVITVIVITEFDCRSFHK